MSKQGRANWPAPGETRTGSECVSALEDLSKQVEVLYRTSQIMGPPSGSGRFINNDLFALANEKLGMTREVFDQTDDWDLLAMLERAIRKDVQPQTPVQKPSEAIAGADAGIEPEPDDGLELLKRVLDKGGIEAFLSEHPDIKRTPLMDFKAGRIARRVSQEYCEKIVEAARRSAISLKL